MIYEFVFIDSQVLLIEFTSILVASEVNSIAYENRSERAIEIVPGLMREKEVA